MDGSTAGRGPSTGRATDAGARGPREAPGFRLLRPVWPPWPVLRRLLRWPGNVYRARQVLHRLSRLTDHELRDIGLTRRDLIAVRALPLDDDPSAVLARWAEERRRALTRPRQAVP